jgi:hypothetical protein
MRESTEEEPVRKSTEEYPTNRDPKVLS